LGYIDNQWFPSTVRFGMSESYVAVGDNEQGRVIELQRGRAIIITRACTLFVYPDELVLYRYSLYEERGGKLWVDKSHVYAEKELYEARELYEMIRSAFRQLLKHFSDIVNS